ncbi:MAG TPA: 30S ribosomal protein S16 [Candidatus Paceibacterota bacterium]|nr:30S ribosomal protein S16 [Candidatus Paceibacterota bacterium]
MLTIRLQRRGRKNDPSFRVILVESKRAAKTGSYKEMLGSYDARTDRVELKADRIKYWMGVGATVSDTVHNILVNQKVIDAKKINVLPRKSPPKKEEPAGDAGAAAVAATAAVTSVANEPEAQIEAETTPADTGADASARGDGGVSGGE